MRGRSVVVLAAVMAVLFVALPLRAQLTRGTILGTITDMTDAVMRSAEISIRNLETGIERQTLSNEVGVYRFPAVEPGK
jgi:hypothetical protein